MHSFSCLTMPKLKSTLLIMPKLKLIDRSRQSQVNVADHAKISRLHTSNLIVDYRKAFKPPRQRTPTPTSKLKSTLPITAKSKQRQVEVNVANHGKSRSLWPDHEWKSTSPTMPKLKLTLLIMPKLVLMAQSRVKVYVADHA